MRVSLADVFTEETFFLGADETPQCALEGMARAIFDFHTANVTGKFNPHSSGAEWWVPAFEIEEKNCFSHASPYSRYEVYQTRLIFKYLFSFFFLMKPAYDHVLVFSLNFSGINNLERNNLVKLRRCTAFPCCGGLWVEGLVDLRATAREKENRNGSKIP